jgi:hypothetical protein
MMLARCTMSSGMNPGLTHKICIYELTGCSVEYQGAIITDNND